MQTKRKMFRFVGLGIALFGVLNLIYFFFPFLSWHLYFAPVFASQEMIAPVPKQNIASMQTLNSLFSSTVDSLKGVDYTNAANWFPGYTEVRTSSPTRLYTVSIPKIDVTHALVSTVDNNLSDHMVNYGGTAVPPEKGNAVIFGHSTLPQLYDPKNYRTILANAYKLKVGDTILVHQQQVTYKYRIINIRITEPEDTSVLIQDFDNSYLTLVTCTPPGTIWQRLIIKARLETI